jgi:hypothetical protein
MAPALGSPTKDYESSGIVLKLIPKCEALHNEGEATLKKAKRLAASLSNPCEENEQ